jgi:hypothetical protein
MKRAVDAVEVFIEKKGGCKGYSQDLFEEFVNCKDKDINKNFAKHLTRKQFELALLRVCRNYEGEIIFNNSKERLCNNRIYIIKINHT